MNCPICGSADTLKLGVKNTFPLALCRLCNHIYGMRQPSPEELQEYYSRYSYTSSGLDSVSPFVFQRLREIADGFESHRHSNRILDVGFGAGAMLKVAEENGWEVHGIELSALAVQQARLNGFQNALEVDFGSAPYKPGYFDVIVATELLEHVSDPLAFIRQASRLLVPNGLFYLTTPNGRGLSSRILGLDWSVNAPQEHLHLFSPQSLRAGLLENGFCRVKILCEGVNPFEILHHFRARLPFRYPAPHVTGFNRGDSSSDFNNKLAGCRSGAAIKRLANWVLRCSRLGDSLKAFAVKSV